MHVADGMPLQADLTLALLLLLFHLAFRITETYSSLLPLTTPGFPISVSVKNLTHYQTQNCYSSPSPLNLSTPLTDLYESISLLFLMLLITLL